MDQINWVAFWISLAAMSLVSVMTLAPRLLAYPIIAVWWVCRPIALAYAAIPGRVRKWVEVAGFAVVLVGCALAVGWMEGAGRLYP